jgi:hypothetical protein
MACRFLIFLGSILLLTTSVLQAQAPDAKQRTLLIKRPEQTAKLVGEFGRLTSEHRSARFDAFFQEISRTPDSTGYVFLYCGKECRYGEVEAHRRGIELKVALRNFDRTRLVVLSAGYRDSFATELWLVPDGVAMPRPNSTINIRHVVFIGHGRHFIEPYDCCDDFSDIWKSIKP